MIERDERVRGGGWGGAGAGGLALTGASRRRGHEQRCARAYDRQARLNFAQESDG